MARVLLANELGTGVESLRRLRALALTLRKQGHEPVLAVHDLPRAEAVLGEHGLRLLQCPLWRTRVGGLPPVHTYCDLLLRHGFVQAQGLRGLARAWRDLVALLQPSLLVLDQAPVALFATRGQAVPRLRFGDGHGCPPLRTPMPPMTWWDSTPEPFDAIGERSALHVANQAAADLGLPGATSIAELLAGDDDALCTLPDLDPYADRVDGRYCGPLIASDDGPARPWPGGEGRCCFVALPAQHPQLEALVGALRATGQRAVLQLADGTPEQAAQLTGGGVVVARTPVPTTQLRRFCSQAVADGSTGVTHAALLAGKPVLLLPTLLEQTMLAHRVHAQGLGLRAEGSSPPLADLLRRLSDEPAWALAAAAFAERHRDESDHHTLDTVVARCEALLAGPGR